MNSFYPEKRAESLAIYIIIIKTSGDSRPRADTHADRHLLALYFIGWGESLDNTIAENNLHFLSFIQAASTAESLL